MVAPEEVTAGGFHGRVYATKVLDAVAGTVVADVDFTTPLAGTTSVTDAAGLVWTVAGTGEIGPFGPPWVDITARHTHAAWGYGRDSALEPFPSGEASLTLANDDRALDPEHTAGPWFGKLGPRTPFRLRTPNTASVLELAADSSDGGRAETPDDPGLDLTAGLDVRLEATRDWELVNGLGEVLAAKYQTVDGGRSWWWALLADGRLRLRWSETGEFEPGRLADSTRPVPAAAAHHGRLAVRVTLQADNDFGQHVVRFSTAPEIGGPWTQLGDAVTFDGTTSVFDASADLTVGTAHGGNNAIVDYVTFTGLLHHFHYLDGINGAVLAEADFTIQDPGATGFTDAAGNPWTVQPGQGAAALIADPQPDELFTGFVEGGFEQRFSSPAKGDAVVNLVDLLGILHGTKLPAHDYEAEVLADDPAAYWPMDEAEGTRMGDRSGNGRNGAYDGGTVGDEVGLVLGSDRSFFAGHVGGNRGRYQGEALPTGPPVTIEAWIRTPRELSFLKTILGVQEGFQTGALVFFGVNTSADTPNGELFFGAGRRVRGHARTDDNRVHHVAVTVSDAGTVALYVDGVVQDQTVLDDVAVNDWPQGRLWTIGDLSNPGGSFGLDGNVGHVAVYDHVLSAARVAAHHTAGVTAFADESTGERIRRILRAGGIPERLWDVAEGDTTVGPAVYDHASVGEHADKVAESEQGLVFIEHRRGGRVAFRGRYSRHQDPRSATTQFTLSDADTPAAVHYERDGLTVSPNGIDSVVNICEVRWRGGTEVARDQASVEAFGAQSRTITTDSPSAQVARSSAQWVVHRHAEPRAQVRGFALDPAADARGLPAALELRISDRVSFTRHPLAVGDPVTAALFCEGVSHEVEGTHWDTAVQTSSAEGIGQVWTWGQGDTWNATTVWG